MGGILQNQALIDKQNHLFEETTPVISPGLIRLQQRLTAEADGYLMVEGNLNEGSGGVQTNLWFKRGSGAAVADITAFRSPASSPDGFEPVSGNTNAPAVGTAQVLLALKKEAQVLGKHGCLGRS